MSGPLRLYIEEIKENNAMTKSTQSTALGTKPSDRDVAGPIIVIFTFALLGFWAWLMFDLVYPRYYRVSAHCTNCGYGSVKVRTGTPVPPGPQVCSDCGNKTAWPRK